MLRRAKAGRTSARHDGAGLKRFWVNLERLSLFAFEAQPRGSEQAIPSFPETL